ncbi:hypothetical protein [Aureimonas jatrophae]|uniref:hypothetical protein n=1 Tax=Aureimonas jatrophae TaxID=1166073 RepID=UPI00160689CD|nr:hypothetical protein [Aureimonas jatrophae]MBB3950470.1 hypothetical protein [Aureimonas jatrophae]
MVFALWLLAASTTQPAPDATPRAQAQPRLAGAASPISPGLCERTADEAWRCSGLAGVDVRLFGPETRRTLSLGDVRSAFPPLPMPGRFATTIDWHVGSDSQPLAAAVRWRAAEGSAELLLVLRPAAEGAPGCVSAVAGPDADPIALAMRHFRCERDRPVLAGTIPPPLRTALDGWLAAL